MTSSIEMLRESVRRFPALLAAGACVIVLAACEQRMSNQPRYEPLEASPFFTDGRASRPLVEGTVARGHLRADTHFYTGMLGGNPAKVFPMAVTRELLARGQERYDIFCSPCHDRVGTGRGMVVRRGFRRPVSFHIQRLRESPVGYLFDVITRGFGVMPDYGAQIPARDRWAIVAYIRALQLSQQATLADVPERARADLMGDAQ